MHIHLKTFLGLRIQYSTFSTFLRIKHCVTLRPTAQLNNFKSALFLALLQVCCAYVFSLCSIYCKLLIRAVIRSSTRGNILIESRSAKQNGAVINIWMIQ